MIAGDRVARRFDGKAGTVVTVDPTYPGTAVAVLLDADGEVWSGTAEAWTTTTTKEHDMSTTHDMPDDAAVAVAFTMTTHDFAAKHPHPHRIQRVARPGDARSETWLVCHTCEVAFAIVDPPAPPLTPMQASLSRFD